MKEHGMTTTRFADRDLMALTDTTIIERIAPVVQEAGMIDYLAGLFGQVLFLSRATNPTLESIPYWKIHDHFAGFGMFLDIAEHGTEFTVQFYQTRGDMAEPWRLSIRVDGENTGVDYLLDTQSFTAALEHHVETLWNDAQWAFHAALYEGTEWHTEQQRALWQNRAPVMVGGKRYGPSEGFAFALDLAVEAMKRQLALGKSA